MEKCDDVWIYISCKVYENEWNSITRVEMRRCWTNLLHLCVLQDPLLRHLGGGVLWIVRVRSMTSSVLRFFFGTILYLCPITNFSLHKLYTTCLQKMADEKGKTFSSKLAKNMATIRSIWSSKYLFNDQFFSTNQEKDHSSITDALGTIFITIPFWHKNV